MTTTAHPSRTARFHRSYKVDDSGCWLWTAKIGRDGYGRFYLARRWLMAHRFAHELLVGPIPEGHDVDHLCRTRLCVRPQHLEAVTHAENMRRTPYLAARVAQTECIHGHAYTPENTGRDSRGCRYCKRCHSLTANVRRNERRRQAKESM